MDKEYLTDYHRENSLAAQEAVKEMLQHPASVQSALKQIQKLKSQTNSSKQKNNKES